MYKRIDVELKELERQQYENELRWQWELTIDEVVDDILLDEGIDCNIRDSEDIEIMLWNREESQIEHIYNNCFSETWIAPIQMVEETINLLAYTKNVYAARAKEKSQRLYEIGRIWIYSDGHLENSPFDLMYDLEEINHIVFSEDIDFTEFPADALSDIFDTKPREAITAIIDDMNSELTILSARIDVIDSELDDISDNITAGLSGTVEALNTINENLVNIRIAMDNVLRSVEPELEALSDTIYAKLVWVNTRMLEIDAERVSIFEEAAPGEESDIGWVPIKTSVWIEDHQYACVPEWISNGLNQDSLSSIFRDISVRNNYSLEEFETSPPQLLSESWTYEPEWSGSAAVPPSGWNYSPVNDELGCEWFFCITVEFQSTNYWAKWENETSVESVLKTVAEHLEKPANASLTQRKMTTNNFEISSIITDLSGMLRGFWIEVQTKPIPILEGEEEESEDDTPYTTINLLHTYYKNLWLDYNRRNDLSVFTNTAYQTKILQTSAGMPIAYPENRLNELVIFQAALAETNRVVSKWIDKKILIDDTDNFVNQFSELEKFVASIEDFSGSVATLIDQMKKIPTRSS